MRDRGLPPTLLECIECALGLGLLSERGDQEHAARPRHAGAESCRSNRNRSSDGAGGGVILRSRGAPRGSTRSPQLPTAVLTARHCGDPMGLVDSLGADAYHSEWQMISGAGRVRSDVIDALHRTGRGVNVWTVSRVDDMQALLEARVSGI